VTGTAATVPLKSPILICPEEGTDPKGPDVPGGTKGPPA
jgi:hypothetical protein